MRHRVHGCCDIAGSLRHSDDKYTDEFYIKETTRDELLLIWVMGVWLLRVAGGLVSKKGRRFEETGTANIVTRQKDDSRL